jgi:rhodanese-related sulfurtransferase
VSQPEPDTARAAATSASTAPRGRRLEPLPRGTLRCCVIAQVLLPGPVSTTSRLAVPPTLGGVTGQIRTVEPTQVPSPLPDDLVILDVREPAEWAVGHIETAIHVPLMQLPRRVAEIPADRRLLVVCRVGARSAQATAFLQAQGLDAINLSGGMQAWEAAGRAMVSETNAAPIVA